MTVKHTVTLHLFAKTTDIGYEPAMPFTPAQDHQVELAISIVHKISCIPEMQSICFLLYWYAYKVQNCTNMFMKEGFGL